MTDYLEEHLGNAEALLKRIRQLEESVSGLSNKVDPEENVHNTDNFDGKKRDIEEKSGIVSQKEVEVYDQETEVNQIKETVDNMVLDLEIREKEQDIVVNRKIRADDNGRDLEQIERSSKEKETNTERAESRPPLSVQLEELDRAVSALSTLIPEGRKTAQSGYPISLPGPRSPAVDSIITGAQGESWNGSGAVVRADSAYGGTQSWAEQADRMFRRDSRRYDGGFYLY